MAVHNVYHLNSKTMLYASVSFPRNILNIKNVYVTNVVLFVLKMQQTFKVAYGITDVNVYRVLSCVTS